MLFNSFDFLVFFLFVVGTYFALPHRFRWFLLLVASYFFYGYWEPGYLLIILFSTIIDFFLGRAIHFSTVKSRKRIFLYLSLLSNLSILFFFKYFNFFLENVTPIVHAVNPDYKFKMLEILLPVGISFYTFQTLSYSIDIYNGKIKQPEKKFGVFALFVSFFPQLVAGPIERASNLLPQFHKQVRFDFNRIQSGITLMLWGLFKKIVIADRLALIVNEIYNNPTEYHGYTLVIGTLFFAVQIYCDFSGYSDIAIGIARVLGFDFMKNFRTPYFSKSIGEFWNRWHISLSTWFRDYLYIPLGGNRVIKWRWYYNLFITFLISGLWHGAEWTFVIWGAFHGALLILETLVKFEKKTHLIRILLNFKTFFLVCVGWVFFRANSLEDASYIFRELFNFNNYSLDQLSFYVIPVAKNTVFSVDFFLAYLGILILMILEYLFLEKYKFFKLPYVLRTTMYVSVIVLILVIGAFGKNEFIYFQF
ncbi:MAG: membrane-bound O-acyltransferase family protein [Flavobacteriales bacterium]|nr:membrane-bound O-acyltransferase family protein [Flavobacteriales bacterium]MBO72265.1 membrane-bound O-acyltransferase family protein [Flavobacteriales bacterium]|tara:strand:+ start:5582 stop:7012 length:1431 start_codon:yes stop_codon:yes gene_type:complete